MRLSGNELQQATGGDWQKGMPDTITGISTDTRRFIEGHAFLALRGPNFDGHRFAEKVVNEAHALIGDQEGAKLWDNLDTPQLQVEDTLTALGDIANAWRNRLNQTTVIAISGSYGKTTVRSMLTHIFKALGRATAATQANLNNLIGVPTTLLTINQDTEVALIECGISEKGEMARLSQIVQPDIAVITGITDAHSSGLGGLEGVVHEKSQLMSHLLPQGWCVFGHGVSQLLRHEDIPYQSVDMDGAEPDRVTWQLDGRTLQLSYGSERAELQLALPARHWAANMALAATVVLKYFHSQTGGEEIPSLSAIASALSEWRAVNGRLATIKGIGGSLLIDDSYNANPVSMQAALDTLATLDGRKSAIIGDMAELEASAAAHAALRLSGIDQVILIGNEMKGLKQKYAEAKWFASTDEALAWLQQNSSQFTSEDRILIKASRSMQLDRIARALAAKGEMHAL